MFFLIIKRNKKNYLVSHPVQEGLDVFFFSMKEPVRLAFRRCEGQQVNGSQPSLFPGRDKHYDWLMRTVLQDRIINWFSHSYQAGRIVSDVKSLEDTHSFIIVS